MLYTLISPLTFSASLSSFPVRYQGSWLNLLIPFISFFYSFVCLSVQLSRRSLLHSNFLTSFIFFHSIFRVLVVKKKVFGFSFIPFLLSWVLFLISIFTVFFSCLFIDIYYSFTLLIHPCSQNGWGSLKG